MDLLQFGFKGWGRDAVMSDLILRSKNVICKSNSVFLSTTSSYSRMYLSTIQAQAGRDEVMINKAIVLNRKIICHSKLQLDFDCNLDSAASDSICCHLYPVKFALKAWDCALY